MFDLETISLVTTTFGGYLKEMQKNTLVIIQGEGACIEILGAIRTSFFYVWSGYINDDLDLSSHCLSVVDEKQVVSRNRFV